MKQGDITPRLMTQKITILKEISLMSVDYLQYLVLTNDFLIFHLCENQYSTQYLLGERGLRRDFFVPYCFHCLQKGLTNQKIKLLCIYLKVLGGSRQKSFLSTQSSLQFQFLLAHGLDS